MKRLLVTFCLLALVGCEKPAPKYGEGDIVRMKIGKLRGQVLQRQYNFSEWDYRVRFPVASMNAQWVGEREIEAAPSTSSQNSIAREVIP